MSVVVHILHFYPNKYDQKAKNKKVEKREREGKIGTNMHISPTPH